MDSNNELGKWIDQYNDANTILKLNTEKKDEASKLIKEIMKENEVISWNGFIVNHTTMTRKKTKMVEVPGADPIITRRFSIKDVR